MTICDYGCGKIATHQFKNKKWCCSSSVNLCEGKRKRDSESKKGLTPNWKNGHPKGMLGKKSWNSGLTLNDMKPEIAKRFLENCRKGGSASPGRCIDPLKEEERRNKISQKMKNYGGLRHGSGRGQKGWYKGYFCDSSWELAWIVYNIDHNITFERNFEKFPYEHDNIKRFFIPDFIMENGLYVEIKGYFTEQVKSKIKYFPHDIKIIDKNEINLYIEYTVNVYGKNFINLYDK